LNLSLRCHEALINLFPQFHELNLAATALTHVTSRSDITDFK